MRIIIDNAGLPVAVAASTIMMLENAKKAAKSSATILIEGETGTGKEVLAHYIHQHSAYATKRFVSVNCAALPENMMEAILFGHEKGAFTGALATHIGKFEQANQGTILLDEISELPYGLQAKLLRVLQEKKVERIGGDEEIAIDTRIVAATNKDLIKEVNGGRFRKDLFYRLNVIKLQCVPLRNRKEDILPLANYFIQLHSQLNGKKAPFLTDAAQNKLLDYSWPGNVREIENVIQRIIVMFDSQKIDAENIQFDPFVSMPEASMLENNEAITIISMLKETAGCRLAAAKKLKISPRTLRYKISRLKEIGLEVPTRG
jgi:two-component system response regulator FlrC